MPAKIENRIKVEASPEQVWAVLGDLAGVPDWIPGIISAQVEGMARVCTTADGQEIKEEISGYSAEKRTYSYRHVQQPLPLKNSHGTFTMQAEGAATVVIWTAEFETPDPAGEAGMTAMVNGFYRQTLESLKQCIEARRR